MDQKTKAIVNTLVGQRNEFADQVAALMGELAERDARITKLQAELEAAKAPPS